MSFVITEPFQFIAGLDGDALDAGSIYYGQPNLDPIQYPKAVYYDVGLTIPATQPVRTVNGYIYRNGSPASLFTDGNYSITVLDKFGRQIYHVPDFLLIGNAAAISAPDLSNTSNISLGDALVGVKQPGTSTIGRTQHDKNKDLYTANDLGATDNGVTDNSAIVNQTILNYGVAYLPITLGSYKIGSVLYQGNAFISDETFAGQGSLWVQRTTSTNKDAIHARHLGTGVGYAVHGISSSTQGSGGGFASDGGSGNGAVGNKYNTGAGHGVLGQNIEGGAGDGVHGERLSTGIGSGVGGVNDTASASGSGVYGQRSNGGGSAIEGLKQGAGAGHAMNGANIGTSTGNGVTGTRESSGAGGPGGHAVEGIRTASSIVRGRGVLGYYDPVSNIGYGVYGEQGAGGSDLAGYFNGSARITAGLTVGTALQPITDGGSNCGHPSFRWGTVYAQTGSINTSDRDSKQQIGDISDRVMRAWGNVKFQQYKFNDAVAQKGPDAARWHFGVIAQEIKEAFEVEGLNAHDYGLLCYDEWQDQFETIPAKTEYVPAVVREEPAVIVGGSVVVPAQTVVVTPAQMLEIEPSKTVQTVFAGSRYGVRYEEALALECAYLRWRLENGGLSV